jgi:hypothetical protein
VLLCSAAKRSLAWLSMFSAKRTPPLHLCRCAACCDAQQEHPCACSCLVLKDGKSFAHRLHTPSKRMTGRRSLVKTSVEEASDVETLAAHRMLSTADLTGCKHLVLGVLKDALQHTCLGTVNIIFSEPW